MQSNKNKENLSFLQKMLTYCNFCKKCNIVFQKVLLLFCKLVSYLLCVLSLKSIKMHSLSKKKYGGRKFTPFPRQQWRSQNTSVGRGLTEFIEPSDTLNYNPLFKHCILQIILHVLLLVIFCVEQNYLFKALSRILHLFCLAREQFCSDTGELIY